MLPHKFRLYWKNGVYEEDFKRVFSIYSSVKINLPLWPNSTTGDHDLKRKKTLKSKQPEDAFREI